jgi:hypothetical protein
MPLTDGAGLANNCSLLAFAGWSACGSMLATLWVLALNEPARRFYERSGWAADGIERGINSGISEADIGSLRGAAAMHYGLC